jgi:hypothetical protein
MSDTVVTQQKSPKDWMKLTIAVLIGLCLFALFVYFLVLIGATILLSPQSPIESLIFYTMVLRVLGVSFVPWLSRTHAQVKIALFSIETFVLVFLIFGYVLTQDPTFDTLIGQVLTAWVGVSAIVLTPYLVYQISTSMYKGLSTSGLTLSITPEYAIGVFLVAFGIANGSNPPSGISSFGSALIGLVRSQSQTQYITVVGTQPFVTAVSMIIFVCLLIYIGIAQRYETFAGSTPPLFSATSMRSEPKYLLLLLLLFAGVAATIAWIAISANDLLYNDLYIFTIPAVIVSATLWGMSRRKKYATQA